MSTAAERQEIRDALAAIAERNGGRLTPDAVVAEAASKASVLHGLFEWDSKKAAHEFRIYQARNLISSVKVITKTERTTVSTVCYVRDPDAERDEQGYVPVATLIGDEERSRTVLVAEFARAAAALRRARELALVFDMVDEIEAVTESIDVMRTKIEASVVQHQAS